MIAGYRDRTRVVKLGEGERLDILEFRSGPTATAVIDDALDELIELPAEI